MKGGRRNRKDTTSPAAWILGVFVFYWSAVLIERQKPCNDQRTNQLTTECKIALGAIR